MVQSRANHAKLEFGCHERAVAESAHVISKSASISMNVATLMVLLFDSLWVCRRIDWRRALPSLTLNRSEVGKQFALTSHRIFHNVNDPQQPAAKNIFYSLRIKRRESWISKSMSGVLVDRLVRSGDVQVTVNDCLWQSEQCEIKRNPAWNKMIAFGLAVAYG